MDDKNDRMLMSGYRKREDDRNGTSYRRGLRYGRQSGGRMAGIPRDIHAGEWFGVWLAIPMVGHRLLRRHPLEFLAVWVGTYVGILKVLHITVRRLAVLSTLICAGKF